MCEQTARDPKPSSGDGAVTIGLLVFLGLGGLFGGIGLIFGLWGMDAIPRESLDRIPLIDSWLIPGLVLVVWFGLGSLITAYGVLRLPPWPWSAAAGQLAGRHWSWPATIMIGLGQLAWLLVEFLYLGPSLLMVIYGAVGVPELVERYLRRAIPDPGRVPHRVRVTQRGWMRTKPCGRWMRSMRRRTSRYEAWPSAGGPASLARCPC